MAEARALLDTGRTGTVELSQDGAHCPGGVTLLVESSLEPPRLIVFGAVDFTAALVRVGKFLGYHVTVCDARPVFTTAARFPEADAVVVDWPHRYLRRTAIDTRTVLCVLTHDAKFDVPLLRVALRLPVAFVGAMGSRRTHDDRVRRLREAGVSDIELARLRAPHRPGPGRPHTAGDGPVHRGGDRRRTARRHGPPAHRDPHGDPPRPDHAGTRHMPCWGAGEPVEGAPGS
ncbi:hypothetical protein GCM10020000_04360 [Streptomyces olivoverticillatus]